MANAGLVKEGAWTTQGLQVPLPTPAPVLGSQALCSLQATEAWRGCGCGGGLLAKDVHFTAPPSPPADPDGFTKAKSRNRRRTNSRALSGPGPPTLALPTPTAPHQLGPRLRNRAGSLGSQAQAFPKRDKLNLVSPPSGHHHHHRRERIRSDHGPGSEFFTDSQVPRPCSSP